MDRADPDHFNKHEKCHRENSTLLQATRLAKHARTRIGCTYLLGRINKYRPALGIRQLRNCFLDVADASCKLRANVTNGKIMMSVHKVRAVWAEKKSRQLDGMYYSNPSFSD